MTESPLPHRNTRLVSGSYSGNITPFDVSNSTMTIGSLNASGARREYCRSDDRLKLKKKKPTAIHFNDFNTFSYYPSYPVVKIRPCRRKIACVAFDPSWQMASLSISPVRGLMIRIFLSLHVVTNLEPDQSKHALYTTSGWQSRWMSISPVPTFQMTTWLSEPAVSNTFCAVGCQSTRPTRRWWNIRSATGSVIVRVSPPSGICHTFSIN